MTNKPDTASLDTTTDAEMMALAALAQCEAVKMAGDNEQRRSEGYSPMWREGCGLMEAGMKLNDILIKRGILK